MSREEHEPALINAFVVAPKRPRLLESLADSKRRKKAIATLDHFTRSLDERFMEPIRERDATPEIIADKLQHYGAPKRCWVISSDESLDNRMWSLDEVLPRVVGEFSGTFVSCIPGELAYYESEEPEDRYILRRKKA